MLNLANKRKIHKVLKVLILNRLNYQVKVKQIKKVSIMKENTPTSQILKYFMVKSLLGKHHLSTKNLVKS